MDKDDYWRAIEKLGRGAKAELARRLGKDGYFVSKMFGSKRKLRHDEVVIIEKLLLDYHGAKMDTFPNQKNVTVPLRPAREIDEDGTRTVRLWTVVPNVGGQMSIAESVDTVSAPGGLKELSKSFTIDVWDDANGARLPRGTTLYISRSIGRNEQYHVFGRPIGRNHTAIETPVLGVLLGKLADAWRVLVGDKEVELPFADYPAAWQVRQIHY